MVIVVIVTAMATYRIVKRKLWITEKNLTSVLDWVAAFTAVAIIAIILITLIFGFFEFLIFTLVPAIMPFLTYRLYP